MENHCRKRPDTGSCLRTIYWVWPDGLVNVCYRLHAQAEFAGHHDSSTWPPHAYHGVFNRALERGQWFYTPCLGWKEFAPDNVGPFRPQTRVCESENHDLPTMLWMVFDQQIELSQN